MIIREKIGSTFKKWSRFPKHLQDGAILAPLFFQSLEEKTRDSGDGIKIP